MSIESVMVMSKLSEQPELTVIDNNVFVAFEEIIMPYRLFTIFLTNDLCKQHFQMNYKDDIRTELTVLWRKTVTKSSIFYTTFSF